MTWASANWRWVGWVWISALALGVALFFAADYHRSCASMALRPARLDECSRQAYEHPDRFAWRWSRTDESALPVMAACVCADPQAHHGWIGGW